MQESNTETGIEARRAPRVELDGQVTIRFDVGSIQGSGQNVSSLGVYFSAATRLPVTVQIAGHPPIQGRLVRVDTMGDGQMGIAVQFDQEQQDLVPDGSAPSR